MKSRSSALGVWAVLALLPHPQAFAVEAGVTESAVQPELRSFNLRVKPLGLAFGIFGAEAQVGILRSLAFGASVDQFREQAAGLAITASEIKFLLSYYPSGDRFCNGWVAQTAFSYMPFEVTRRTTTYHPTLGAVFVGGYEWDAQESGLNALLGTGLYVAPSKSSDRILPSLVFQVGWAI